MHIKEKKRRHSINRHCLVKSRCAAKAARVALDFVNALEEANFPESTASSAASAQNDNEKRRAKRQQKRAMKRLYKKK